MIFDSRRVHSLLETNKSVVMKVVCKLCLAMFRSICRGHDHGHTILLDKSCKLTYCILYCVGVQNGQIVRAGCGSRDLDFSANLKLPF